MAMEAERQLFADSILGPVGQAAQFDQRMARSKLTGFLAMKGGLYKTGGLMVVGRAVNGWGDGVQPTFLAGCAFRTKFSRQVMSDANDRPMEWVSDY